MPDKKDSGLEGQSFDNAALTGSGTILPDGSYGPSQPDPTEVRGLGSHKTSGGREVRFGGLGGADETSPTTTEDATTRKQSSSSKK